MFIIIDLFYFRHSSRDYRSRDGYSSSSRSHTEYRTESGKSRDPYKDSVTGKPRDPIRELDKSKDHRESQRSRSRYLGLNLISKDNIFMFNASLFIMKEVFTAIDKSN